MNRPGSSRRGTLGGGGTLLPTSALTSSSGAPIPASATLPAAVAAAVVPPDLPASLAPHLNFAPTYSDVALLASEANAPPVAFEAPEIDEVPSHIPIGARLFELRAQTNRYFFADDDVPVIDEPSVGVLFREHDERVSDVLD